MEEFRTRLDLDVEHSLEAVERAAELWGATWRRSGTGGRLELPVQAGLREGIVTAAVSARASDGGTDIVVRVESSDYRLQSSAVTILSIGGLGALPLLLWPLYPKLLALAPVALIFIVIAWLAVASRLQNSGVEEFLRLVAGEDADPAR